MEYSECMRKCTKRGSTGFAISAIPASFWREFSAAILYSTVPMAGTQQSGWQTHKTNTRCLLRYGRI
jgi:hypothetical protein